jgi:hypothetical protein
MIWSRSNILNSLAIHVGSQLLNRGALLHWHAAGALQTPGGWYDGFSADPAAVLALTDVATAAAAARTIVTMLDAYPAEPRFVTRLISESTLSAAHETPVPAVVVSVAQELATSQYELGTRLRYRRIVAMLEAACRDQYEQRWLADVFREALDDDLSIAVRDHDAGTAELLGYGSTQRCVVGTDTYPDAAGSLTYQVVATAVVEYVA